MIPNDLDNVYSLGTAPIMNTLLHMLNEYKTPPDTVMINVDTIIRNCGSIEAVNTTRKFEHENNLKYTRSVRRQTGYAQHEVQTVLTEVINMFNEQSITNPTIVLYLGSYKQFIPPIQQRRVSESKMPMSQSSSQMEASVTARMSQKSGKVNIIQLPKMTMKLPYKVLTDEQYDIKNNHVVAMISHHALDYHLYKYCSAFYLLNSYTGKVSTAADQSKKVFEVEGVPFNSMTHALLGDKEDILPALKQGERKKLIDIAVRESWISHTEDYVADRQKDLGVLIPFKI